MARANWLSQIGVLVCLVAIVSYLSAQLGGALAVHPPIAWPLWPGCAILVGVLLLVQRKISPLLILAAFTGFVLDDLQAGVKISSITGLILADTSEVLTAALCISYSFRGLRSLNSLKARAQYSFFAVIIAPVLAASVGALALQGCNHAEG